MEKSTVLIKYESLPVEMANSLFMETLGSGLWCQLQCRFGCRPLPLTFPVWHLWSYQLACTAILAHGVFCFHFSSLLFHEVTLWKTLSHTHSLLFRDSDNVTQNPWLLSAWLGFRASHHPLVVKPATKQTHLMPWTYRSLVLFDMRDRWNVKKFD